MPIFPVERSEATYCIDVGVDFMLSIMDRDYRDLPLYERLEGLWCHNVEYDGHFGPYIFVSMTKQYDTAHNMQKIMKMIDDHARGKKFPDDD